VRRFRAFFEEKPAAVLFRSLTLNVAYSPSLLLAIHPAALAIPYPSYFQNTLSPSILNSAFKCCHFVATYLIEHQRCNRCWHFLESIYEFNVFSHTEATVTLQNSFDVPPLSGLSLCREDCIGAVLGKMIDHQRA
jgi:hypothetical protein